MCGRLFQTLPLSRLLRIARTSKVHNGEFHTSSFNVCPTTYIPVIKRSDLYAADTKQKKQEQMEGQKQDKDLDQKINEAIADEGQADKAVAEEQPIEDKPERELSFMKWGQKTNFNMIVNGRIEELTNKKTFAKIIQNRCVVIMEGYYEWKSKEEPFVFRPKSADHFMVAGLFTEENEVIILTKDATPELAKVHERMPVILSPSEVELWLDPKNTSQINTLIQRGLTNKSKAIWKNIGLARVAPHVNKREEKTVKCLMTVEEYKKQLDSKGLMRFWGKKTEKVQTVGKDGETIQEKSQTKGVEAVDKAERKSLPAESTAHDQAA